MAQISRKCHKCAALLVALRKIECFESAYEDHQPVADSECGWQRVLRSRRGLYKPGLPTDDIRVSGIRVKVFCVNLCGT